MGIYQTSLQWMAGNGQAMAYGTASSSQSAAFPTGTSAIRVVSSSDVWLEISLGASASAGVSGFLPANLVEYLPAGESNTLSAKAATLNGILYIKPCCG